MSPLSSNKRQKNYLPVVRIMNLDTIIRCHFLSFRRNSDFLSKVFNLFSLCNVHGSNFKGVKGGGHCSKGEGVFLFNNMPLFTANYRRGITDFVSDVEADERLRLLGASRRGTWVYG